jgi:hypothetical protein
MIHITITNEYGKSLELDVLAYRLSVLESLSDAKLTEYIDWHSSVDGKIVRGNKYTPPRYDDVYNEGMEQLDKLNK